MKKFLFTIYIIVMIFLAMACSDSVSGNKEEEKNYYSVIFKTNCETDIEKQEIEEGKTVKEPSLITKVGYIFEGWYYQNKIFDFATPITSNITLSAKWNPIKYSVSFDKNCGAGDDMQNMSCVYDEEKSLPLNVFKAPVGMQFLGWSTQKDSLFSNYSDGQKIKNLTTENNATITFYAIWAEKNEHSIIYENILFDGEIINNLENPQSYYESKNIELHNIERKGYDFSGWFTDKDCSDSNKITGWSAGEKTEDLILYAKWTPIIYKITYEGLENATNPNTITSYTIEDSIELQLAIKDDYNCLGWNNGSETIQNIPEGTTGDIKLTAQWELKEYEITYILNGGENVTNLTKYTISTNVVLSNPKRTGYDFEGWFEDSSFSNLSISSWKAGEKHGNITLYAKWKIIPYKVSFQTEYGIAPETITVNPNMILTESQLPILQSDEKRFSGWFVGDIKVVAGTYIVTKDVTLTAKWDDIRYTVAFNSNGGSFVSSITVIRNNKAIKPDNPYKSATISKSYVFEGWFTSEDGGTTLSTKPFDFYNTKITTDIILYAKWSEITITYIVVFNSNGGSKVLEQSVIGGDKVPKPNNPSKNSTLSTQYAFLNWYTSSDNGNTLSNQPFDFETPITENITLYAKWTEILINYSVTFYPNNGNDITTQTVRGGNKAEAPSDISKDDTETIRYKFEGWYETPDNGLTLSSQPFDFDNTIIISDTALYAKYQEIPIYRITFNSNGGNDIDTQIIEVGNKATKPVKPKKERTETQIYVFTGWYISEDNGMNLSENEFNFENTEINENVSLYAKWNEVALYQFHSTVTSFGSVTLHTDGYYDNGWYKEFVLVYFGDWPQTIKADNVTVDESESITMGAHTYYIGDDGNYYVKCIKNENVKAKLPDGTIINYISKTEKYFKVEPIKWRAISVSHDDDYEYVTLVAEDVLTANVPFYLDKNNRWINNTTIYPNNYMYSTIRAYLTGVYEEGDPQEQIYKDKGFLQTAFTLDAQSNVIHTSPNLLSESTATWGKAGFNRLSRKKKPTDYALDNGAQTYDEETFGHWRLSSPSEKYNDYTIFVDHNGEVSEYNICAVDDKKTGIVPIMTVHLSQEEYSRVFE